MQTLGSYGDRRDPGPTLLYGHCLTYQHYSWLPRCHHYRSYLKGLLKSEDLCWIWIGPTGVKIYLAAGGETDRHERQKKICCLTACKLGEGGGVVGGEKLGVVPWGTSQSALNCVSDCCQLCPKGCWDACSGYCWLAAFSIAGCLFAEHVDSPLYRLYRLSGLKINQLNFSQLIWTFVCTHSGRKVHWPFLF